MGEEGEACFRLAKAGRRAKTLKDIETYMAQFVTLCKCDKGQNMM